MLYISRRFSFNQYGVVDTEDGIEDRADLTDIADAAEAGIEIRGLETIDGEIKYLYVYQPLETIEPWQTKLKVMTGVDMKLFNGQLVGVDWTSPNFKSGTKLELSKYSTNIGQYIFTSSKERPVKTLIVVLDDKIEFTHGLVAGTYNLPIKFDITSVADNDSVKLIYDLYISKSPTVIDEHIIDKPDRLHYYSGIGIILKGAASMRPEWRNDVLKPVSDFFREKFMTLMRSELVMREGGVATRECQKYFKILWERRSFWRNGAFDFTYMTYMDGLEMFPIIGTFTNFNADVLHQIYTYFSVFGGTVDLKDGCLKFCHRVATGLLDYGEKRGWER